MPCYEAILITTSETAASVLKTSALAIMDNGGVVRGFKQLSQELQLPYKMKRHQIIHSLGRQVCMQFDSSPVAMADLRRALGFDERVIRRTIVKCADSLPKLSKVPPLKRSNKPSFFN